MRRAAAALLLVVAAPAAAQDRPLCADRPGLGSPACTVAPGAVLVETALADWTRDAERSARSDTLLLGDTLVRIGIAERAELQLGWTPFGRQRDRVSAAVTSRSGVGDVLLGAKVNLASPDGTGFSLALQPAVTLPVGGDPLGAGDWSATLAAPVSFDLSDTVQLQATPAIEAAADADRRGRHLAIGSVVGVGVPLAPTVAAAIEVQLTRDDDPSGATTQALAGLALAWQPRDDVQIDIGGAAGLNRDTPDVRLYLGIARLF